MHEFHSVCHVSACEVIHLVHMSIVQYDVTRVLYSGAWKRSDNSRQLRNMSGGVIRGHFGDILEVCG